MEITRLFLNELLVRQYSQFAGVFWANTYTAEDFDPSEKVSLEPFVEASNLFIGH